jgi:ABC-type uncharacterized transport system involved in gliding motility auxiliary subunit
MTVLAEQLSGDRRYSYLNFEEFLLFLVHCALFWKLDWVNQDQPDEPEEEEVVPSTKKDEKKKPPARPPAKLAKASKVEEPVESSESRETFDASVLSDRKSNSQEYSPGRTEPT